MGKSSSRSPPGQAAWPAHSLQHNPRLARLIPQSPRRSRSAESAWARENRRASAPLTAFNSRPVRETDPCKPDTSHTSCLKLPLGSDGSNIKNAAEAPTMQPQRNDSGRTT